MPVNNLYYNKYIKYKNKYLNLQSQMGGVLPIDGVYPVSSLQPTRQKSTFISCQGGDGTCWAHVTIRLIMKLITNFFNLYFSPRNKNCNYYYNTIICSNATTNIFDCFLQIRNQEIECSTIFDKQEEINWSEENFYALLFHFIFLTLVEQFGRQTGVSPIVSCLYILDYLKYIDITEDKIKTTLKYDEKKYTDPLLIKYFNELITRAVTLFSFIKVQLNNKIFNPKCYCMDYIDDSRNSHFKSIYEYTYGTESIPIDKTIGEYKIGEYKIVKYSFLDKLNAKIPFSRFSSDLNIIYEQNNNNLERNTGTDDVKTNIKYVLSKYYAIFATNNHAIIITGFTEDGDDVLLNVLNSWGEGYCKKNETDWCSLINNGQISMNILLTWHNRFQIIFFYPIDYTYLTNESITYYEEIMPWEATVLEQNSTLTKLAFMNHGISYDIALLLAKVLNKNKTLTELIFNNTKMSKDEINPIVEALKTNGTLRILNLTGNNLRNDGVIAIAEALKYNTTLRILNLTSNYLRNEGVIAIAEALKYNTTLTEINLSSNMMIGVVGIKAILEALKTNQTLIKIDLSKYYQVDDIVEAIASFLKISGRVIEFNLK